MPNQQIDLVVTDVVMRGMNGREFVEALNGGAPGIPVVYMSGYTDDDIIRRGLMDSSVTFPQRPFTAKSLARSFAASSTRSEALGCELGDVPGTSRSP